ncbi:MAG: transposase [Thermofilum sp.]|uniref:RNA-guided endonuclease InsQ/TnpB family protein n=1 Tax=Thermofilum sp. TaxID=1961369 RepID=UPI0031646DE1
MNEEKNRRIREKIRATRAKRKEQTAKVYEIKLDKSKISKRRCEALKRLFLEGKWFTNYIISKGITNVVPEEDYKVNKVEIKVGDKFEERELTVLSAQMKQSLINRLQSNVKALHALKVKGKKVGKIRYKKALHSIPLMQCGITYRIDSRDKVYIQGLGKFKVIGIDQIPRDAELANANFIERNGDYLLHVVTYVPKEQKVHNGKAIGIDLGIKDQITFSNGIKVQYAVPMPDRIRRLYKAFSRSKYKEGERSKRGMKLLQKIRRAFQHHKNQKKDIINKIVHYVTTHYEYIAYQDDYIASWVRLYGKRIHETSIGELRERLRRKASTPLEVGRFTRTTGVCINCGTVQHLSLSDRMVVCPSCHSVLDRDVGAAIRIKQEGLCLGNLGETLAEDDASVSSMLEYMKSIPHVKASMSGEARSPNECNEGGVVHIM